MKRGAILQLLAPASALSAVAVGMVFCSGGDVPAPESLQATVRPSTAVPEFLEFPYFPPSPTALPRARKIVLPTPGDSTIAATPALLGAPRCEFGPWDRAALVVYDTRTCETIRLGPGVRGEFNKASTHFAWVEQSAPYEPGIAKVIDLTTRRETELGAAEYVSFNEHNQVLLTASQTVVAAYSLSGSRVAERTPTPYAPEENNFLLSNEQTLAVENYRLFVEPIEGVFADPRGHSRMIVTDLNRTPLYEFEAAYALGVEPHHLAIVDRAVGFVDDDWTRGRQNIFLLDLRTGVAEFFANVSVDHRIGGTEDFLILVDGACNAESSGSTVIVDRATNTARVVPAPIIGSFIDDRRVRGIARLTPGYDRLAIIFFDPSSLEVDVQVNGWVPLYWSNDGRYLSPYIKQGGGFCL